jgi:hypothetical protein
MTSALHFDRKVSLEDWIDGVNRDADKGVLTAIRVKHRVETPVGVRDGDEVFGTMIVTGKPWSPKELAAQIKGRCEVFAQELPGTQTFKVFGYHGQDEATSFHHISAHGRTLDMSGVSEDATPRGMAMQGMRMGDAVVTRVFTMHDQLWNVSKHLMAELKEDRDEWRKEARDGFEVVNKLIQQKINDNHAHRMEELKYQRNTHTIQKLVALLPALLRHITKNKDLIPDGMADTAILETAARAIHQMDASQKSATMTSLVGISPELAMILGQRLQELTTKIEREDEALALLSQAKTADEKAADEKMAKEILEMSAGGAGPALGTGDPH